MTNAHDDLPRNRANFAPLTPLTFLDRAGDVFGHRPAYAYDGARGSLSRTWAEVHERCTRLASALAARGIGAGDTVAAIAPNIPEMFELQFAVACAGAVLNPINVRLDTATFRYILEHGQAKVLITDTRFADTVAGAIEGLDLLVVDIEDAITGEEEGRRLGALDYEALVAEGTADFAWHWPADEWDAISLNYTSGTTSDPKGVVVHHRGAHLIALGTIAGWPLVSAEPGQFPVHMSVVPLFHCNGWGHTWALAANGGMSVLIRNVTAANLYGAILRHRVTHFGGAPIVLSMLVNATDAEKADFRQRPEPWPIRVYTAAAPPPPSVLSAVREAGFLLTHVYGLTETYGHVVECIAQEEWADFASDELAAMNARQGVRFAVTDGLMVADPDTMQPVPRDGETMGEIMIRGNTVMKGYFRNPEATRDAFAGGYFHTGDLAVWHADGYVQIRDRSKDIIISGGENISSVEIEAALFAHPAVVAAAVVAAPDERWGEVPAAFVELRDGASVTEAQIIAHCREKLAGFKVPKRVVFGELPKTSTGKIQKFVLRERVREG